MILPLKTHPVEGGGAPPEAQVELVRTASEHENVTFYSRLTFQLDPSDELVSFMTAWLDSKILLLRLRWQFT